MFDIHNYVKIGGKILEEKEKLVRMSEIALILDEYDEIFSDFDPRPYNQKGLSDDFITESKKAVRDREFGVAELKLLLPHKKRDSYHESIIIKRLKEHFKKHHQILSIEQRGILKQGWIFTISGIFLMFFAVFILYEFGDSSLITSFMIVLLEPGGWFLFWEGLDLVIFDSKKKKPDYKFYETMSKAKVSFMGY